MKREYMPAFLRRKYELAEINYALEHIHFPRDQKELLFARKRLVSSFPPIREIVFVSPIPAIVSGIITPHFLYVVFFTSFHVISQGF